MSKGAGEADVKLLFGASEASFGKISDDIEAMLKKLDSKDFKIKFGADLDDAKKEAEKFAKNVKKITEDAMSSAGSIKMPSGKTDMSSTKSMSQDMAKIATDSAKAAANIIKMSSSLSSNNITKISEAFSSKEISISDKNIANIVNRLSEANVVLEKAKVSTSQLVDKEQKLVSLKLSGKNADNDQVEYLVKFNKKTGEIKEILGGITVEMEKQNNASAKSKQQVVSDNKQKTASYDQLRDAYKRAMSVTESNTAASGLQSYANLLAQLTEAKSIIEAVETKWASLSSEEQAATSKAEIFASVLSKSSSNAASTVDGLTNKVRDLQTEMNLTGVSGKQVDLGAVVSKAEDYLSSNQIFKEEAEYTTLQNLVNQYSSAVKKAKDESISLDEALSGMGVTGAEAAKKLSSAMGSLSDKIKATREETKVAKDYNNTVKNLQNVVDNWTKAKNSLKDGSSEAYNKISDELTNLNDVWAKYSNGAASIGELKRAVASANDVYAQNSKIIKSNGDATQTWGEKLSSLVAKFGNWFSASQLVLKGIETVKKMVSAVIELDTAMTELKKVTDETEAAYDAFLDRAESRTKQLGASLSDTVTATADFARLGFSIEDAEKLADSAIVYKNVGDGIADISEASESIISTMQAFDVEANDVMTIVDKFNEVGNKYAISSKGVGDAMLRSASAMEAAGNTMDETIALITAANEVIQNPEKVGTALKSISMFLRAAKTEAEDAGESTEGMAKSVSELRSEILALTGGKVDIQIDENTFKSTTEILRELSQVWGELTDVTQANILEMIGGKHHSNITSALLENFDTVEKVIETSAGAAGSALAENEKVLDSIQGKINVFKAAFEALSNSVVSSDIVKTTVSIGTGLLEITSDVFKLVNALGGLKTILAVIIGLNVENILSKIFSIFDKIINGSFVLTSSINPWVAGITAVVASIISIWNVIKNVNEKAIQDAVAVADAYKDQEAELKNNKKTLDEISERYTELSKGVDAFGKNRNLSTDEYEEYKDIVGQIAEMFPNVIQGYNDEGTAILSLKGTVDELTEAYNQLIIAKSNEVLDKTPELFKDFEKQRQKYEPQTVSSSTWGSNWKPSDGLTMKTVDALKKMISSDDIESAIIQYANQNSENSQRILYALREKGLKQNTGESDNQFLARALREHKDIVGSLITEFESEIQSSVKSLQSDASAYIARSLAGSFSDIPDEIKNILMQIPASMDYDFFSSFNGDTDAYYDYLNDLLSKFSELSNEDQNTIKVGFDLQTKLNNGECSVGEYLSWSEKIETLIGGFDDKTQSVFKLMFDIDTENTKAKYNKVMDAIGSENKAWLGRLSSEELQVAYDLVVKDDDVDLSQLEAAITKTRALANENAVLHKSYDSLSESVKANNDVMAATNYVSVTKLTDSEKGQIDYYQSELKKASKLGVDLDKTVYGNIDLNARQALEWTKETLDKYKKELMSWAREGQTWNDVYKEFFGTESTVYGGSENFDGIEIAFSPMLQTDKGAVLLSRDTVMEYIGRIIDEAKNNSKDGTWSTEDLLKIDAKGLEVNGQKIKGVIADVGDTATKTAEAMHFGGVDGSIAGTYKKLEEIADKYGVTVEQILANSGSITKAYKSFADNTYITKELYDSLAVLAGGESNLSDCIDTTNGYLITNAEALNELVNASEYATKKNLELAVSHERLNYHELTNQLYDLVNPLTDCADATDAYTDSLDSSINAVLDQINTTELQIEKYRLLEQQLLGATNAFTEYANAQKVDEETDYTDDYESMLNGLLESYKNKEFGTESFWTAFKAIVPDSIYGQFEDAGEQIDAGWEYIKNKIAKYAAEEDSSSNSDKIDFKIDYDGVKKFVTEGLNKAYGDSAVFTGTLDNFAINSQITSIEELADAMGVTTTTAFAMGNAISKYTSDNKDFLSSFDTDSLEGNIASVDQELVELLKHQAELAKSGKIDTDDWTNTTRAIANAKTEMQNLAKESRNQLSQTIENNKAIENQQSVVDQIATKLQGMNKEDTEFGVTYDSLVEADKKLAELMHEKYEIGEPTEVTIQLALEQVGEDLDSAKKKMAELGEYDEKTCTYKIKPGVDQSDFDRVSQQIANLENEEASIKAYAQIDDEDVMESLNTIQNFKIDDKDFAVEGKFGTTKQDLQDVIDLIKSIPGYKCTVVETTYIDSTGGGEIGRAHV